MRKLMILLQLIIILAVGLLYVLYFYQNKILGRHGNEENLVSKSVIKAGEKVNYSFAYINSDSILVGYSYYLELKNQLESQQNYAEKQVEAKAKELENTAQSLKTMVDKKLITEDEAQMKYMTKQQDLEKFRSSLSDNLMESQKKLTEQLYDTIASFLSRYNKKAGFAYIFSYTKGGPIIIAPKNLDLTKDVLKGLNEEYKKKK